TAWVGAQERPEFLRQTRALEEAWQRKGGAIDAHYAPGHHHFSVIEPLTDPDSDLTEACLRP
ncbi:MAG: alpha/beta hydrolase, partial [Shimia sp.]